MAEADHRDAPAFTVWLTGLSGSGKSSIARAFGLELASRGRRVEILDGDALRRELSPELGFSKAERDAHICRIGYLCQILNRHGVVAIVAVISPYQSVRDEVRGRVANFVEVYCRCPLDVLMERDPKGLYRRALAGEIPNFTGISDPYEEPEAPELVLDTAELSEEEAVRRLLSHLAREGLL